MEEKKYFYAAVIDDYKYSRVATYRFKNFVDFAIWCWDDDIEEELKNYIDETEENNIDWQEFFEEYYGYTTYYFALDENGNELEDLEDNNVTLNEYCKKHKLLP